MAKRNNLALLDLDVVFATACLMTAKLTSILQRFFIPPMHVPTALSLDQLVGSIINGSLFVRKTDNTDFFFTILSARNSIANNEGAA